MKQALTVLILLCVSAFAKAQTIQDYLPKIKERHKQATDTLDRVYDQSNIEARSFSDLNEVYTGNEFDYDEVQQSGDNILVEFFDWLFSGLEDIFGIELGPDTRQFLEYAIYVALGILVIYFLIRLLSNQKPEAMLGKGRKKNSAVSIEDTHIEEVDLQKLIDENISNEDYRSAVRYLYLDTLKRLSREDRIEWDFQKTNADYYREIRDPDVKAGFKEISYLYDHIWYGGFMLEKSRFERVYDQFRQFNKKAA